MEGVGPIEGIGESSVAVGRGIVFPIEEIPEGKREVVLCGEGAGVAQVVAVDVETGVGVVPFGLLVSYPAMAALGSGTKLRRVELRRAVAVRGRPAGPGLGGLRTLERGGVIRSAEDQARRVLLTRKVAAEQQPAVSGVEDEPIDAATTQVEIHLPGRQGFSGQNKPGEADRRRGLQRRRAKDRAALRAALRGVGRNPRTVGPQQACEGRFDGLQCRLFGIGRKGDGREPRGLRGAPDASLIVEVNPQFAVEQRDSPVGLLESQMGQAHPRASRAAYQRQFRLDSGCCERLRRRSLSCRKELAGDVLGVAGLCIRERAGERVDVPSLRLGPAGRSTRGNAGHCRVCGNELFANVVVGVVGLGRAAKLSIRHRRQSKEQGGEHPAAGQAVPLLAPANRAAVRWAAGGRLLPRKGRQSAKCKRRSANGGKVGTQARNRWVSPWGPGAEEGQRTAQTTKMAARAGGVFRTAAHSLVIRRCVQGMLPTGRFQPPLSRVQSADWGSPFIGQLA